MWSSIPLAHFVGDGKGQRVKDKIVTLNLMYASCNRVSMMTMAGRGNARSVMRSIRPVWTTAPSNPLMMVTIRGYSRATLRGVNA